MEALEKGEHHRAHVDPTIWEVKEMGVTLEFTWVFLVDDSEEIA